MLQGRGLKVGTGTIVDATIIGAPSSTKNADGKGDPEMHQTKKGQQWYFGMKLHIGVDSQSGLTHSAVVTAANVHDKHPLPDLLHGGEQRVYGDSAYASQQELIAREQEIGARCSDGNLVSETIRASRHISLHNRPDIRLQPSLLILHAHEFLQSGPLVGANPPLVAIASNWLPTQKLLRYDLLNLKPSVTGANLKSLHAQRGVTLIEAMVTVAIAVILASVAVPSFTNVVRKFKSNSLSSELAASLQQARNEAVKTNGRVLVCARNVTGSDCAASTDWGRSGWLVCYDLNGDDSCDASTSVLPNPIKLNGAVDPEFATVTGPVSPVRFNATGSQGGLGAATVTISIRGKWTGASPIDSTVSASGLIKSKKL